MYGNYKNIDGRSVPKEKEVDILVGAIEYIGNMINFRADQRRRVFFTFVIAQAIVVALAFGFNLRGEGNTNELAPHLLLISPYVSFVFCFLYIVEVEFPQFGRHLKLSDNALRGAPWQKEIPAENAEPTVTSTSRKCLS